MHWKTLLVNQYRFGVIAVVNIKITTSESIKELLDFDYIQTGPHNAAKFKNSSN